MRKNFWEYGRVKLRAAEEADLPLFTDAGKSPDSVRQWYEDEVLFPLSEKDARDGFTDDLNNYYKDDKKLFIVETAEDGAYAGQLSVWHTNRRSGVFRHGIFFEENYRGKGLAREALAVVLDFYFNELNYRKACPYIYAYNNYSLKFHEKFGFAFEARLKDEHFTRGAFHDVLYYGMFKDAFNETYADMLWRAD